MSGALDPTNPDDDIPVIPLDMDAIYSAAKNVKIWDLEFECDGITFKWAGKASSRAAAELKARAEMSDLSHNFHRYAARLVAALEMP